MLTEKIKTGPKDFTLINFFATWCKPCRKEMPELVVMGNNPEKKLNLILISIDEPEKIKTDLPAYLGNVGVDYESFFISAEHGNFVRGFFPGWNGRIPLSLLYAKNGEQISVIEGITSTEEIEMLIHKYETTRGQ